MPPPLSSVGPGDPLPTDRVTWNAMIGAGRAYLTGRPGTDAPGGIGAGGDAQLLVRVRNDTGADLPAFSVLAVGEPLVSAAESPHEVRQMPVVPGTVPAAATDAVVVTTEPIGAGAIGRAAALGVVPVKVAVSSAAHTCAVPVAGATDHLASAASGPARLWWTADASGTVQAVVLLQGAGGAGTLYVRAATTATALPANTVTLTTITGNANGALPAQDGVTLVADDSLLVKNQGFPWVNDIYVVTTVGDGSHPFVLTRRGDLPSTVDDTSDAWSGLTVFVREGTLNASRFFYATGVYYGSPYFRTGSDWTLLGKLGTGTDEQVTRWDGTDRLQGSLVTISDTGVVTINGGALYSSTWSSVHLNVDGYARAQGFIVVAPFEPGNAEAYTGFSSCTLFFNRTPAGSDSHDGHAWPTLGVGSGSFFPRLYATGEGFQSAGGYYASDGTQGATGSALGLSFKNGLYVSGTGATDGLTGGSYP